MTFTKTQVLSKYAPNLNATEAQMVEATEDTWLSTGDIFQSMSDVHATFGTQSPLMNPFVPYDTYTGFMDKLNPLYTTGDPG